MLVLVKTRGQVLTSHPDAPRCHPLDRGTPARGSDSFVVKSHPLLMRHVLCTPRWARTIAAAPLVSRMEPGDAAQKARV